MKILVLAGGLSPERNVSLSSGAKVCQALRDLGHRVALVDLFFGLDGRQGSGEDLYDAPIPESFRTVDRAAPDLEQVRARRKTGGASAIGPGVLELCAGAEVVYLALHGGSKRDIMRYVSRYYDWDFCLDEIRPTYKFDHFASVNEGTVPYAVQAFLESEDFEDAIRNVISIGGDSDTLAAITGSVAEAYYGVSSKIRDCAYAFLDERLLEILTRFETLYPGKEE